MSETETTLQMPDPARLVVSNSPHVRDGQSINKIMFTVVLAMLPACLAGIWFFGFAALKVLLLCTVSCVVIEEGWNKLTKRASTWKDGSTILTGILLGMNLNAGVPWWVCILGGILAIVLGKQLFGGLGYNPFNPALVARVGLLIGLPEIMTTWNATRSMGADVITTATPLGMAPADTTLGNLFIGNVGGCLGETSAIALLIGVTLLIFVSSGMSDRETVVASILVGAALCVAMAQATDLMLDLKTGFLVGAIPRKQQIAQFLGTWLGPILVMGLIIVLHRADGLGSDRLPAPQGQALASGTFIGRIFVADQPAAHVRLLLLK